MAVRPAPRMMTVKFVVRAVERITILIRLLQRQCSAFTNLHSPLPFASSSLHFFASGSFWMTCGPIMPIVNGPTVSAWLFRAARWRWSRVCDSSEDDGVSWCVAGARGVEAKERDEGFGSLRRVRSRGRWAEWRKALAVKNAGRDMWAAAKTRMALRRPI